jgi:nucleoside-diphosphate-sugar epimerase
MNVLVTGHKGYIGVHLVDLLQQAGHRVIGCDLGLYAGCEWRPPVRPDVEWTRDVRFVGERDLAGVDAICHLAAISNDPMGEVDPAITLNVNRDGSIALARAARRAGVPRFLLAGSCSVYGRGETLDLDETARLNPLSAYAKSKVEAEQAIAPLADADFCPVFLRNSTAYGDSPMLRIDLVVNNLLGCALAKGDIRIMSDGSPWRPLVHCRDIARAFVALLDAPADVVRGRAVNIGGNSENYQVRDVAEEVQRLVPSALIAFTGEVGTDPRDYRVNFDLLGRLVPDFRLAYDLRRGMEQLHRSMVDAGFSAADFDGPRFVRLRTLRPRLELLTGRRAA